MLTDMALKGLKINSVNVLPIKYQLRGTYFDITKVVNSKRAKYFFECVILFTHLIFFL